MADRSVVVRLLASVDSFRASMRQAEDSVKGVGDQTDKTSQQATTALGRMARSAQDNRGAWDQAGTALTVFGAAATAALGMTVKAAMDWESAWAGVTKTLPDGADFAATEKGLRELARTLPATHSEIAAVAEAAGQLGVAADAIVPFTETMVALGETTNLSADEAATSIAQMMNVMRTAPEDVGRLGAALVELGNNGASTEADIMNLASYLTGSAQLIGATESDVLALANTMASLGINAERGGGVMSRTMQDIYNAVSNGGEALEGFAKVAGMSGADFARAFEADPIRAIGAFTDGLAAAKDRGENVVGILGELGIKGTQDTAVLLQMAGAQGMLNDNLDMGAKAWADNTALIDEANKRYDTTEAKLAIAKNNIVDAAISIGETFLPILADVAEKVASVAQWFGELPAPIQAAIGGLAGVAGVAALAAGAFLLVFPRAIETYKAFQTLNTSMPGVASGLGKIGKAAGIAGALYAASTATDALMRSMGPAPATMAEAAEALLAVGTSVEEVDALFRAQSGWGNEIDGLREAFTRLTDPGVQDQVGGFVAKLTGLGDKGVPAVDRLHEVMGQLDQQLADLVSSGNTELAAEKFDAMVKHLGGGAEVTEKLLTLFPQYRDLIGEVGTEQEVAAEAARVQANQTVLLARDLEGAYGSIEGYAAAMGYSEEQTEALVKKTGELGQSLADFINPLGTYTSMLDEKKAAEEAAAVKAAEAAGASSESWRDFVVDTGFSFDEYMRRLEEQVTAQTNWQTNMLILAGRVSQGTLEELKRMGPEGAPLVADLVNRSDAELDRFDDVTARRSKEATDAMATQLTLAAPVLAAVAGKAGQGAAEAAARELAAGTTTIADIARQYGVELANGVNPILSSLGKPLVNLGRGNFRGRQGGVLFEADGGVLGGGESHVAQIAPAGAWRVWAEPETGGEAYIPLSPAKRARSLDIWRETGRRLGIDEIEAYANGGFSTAGDVPKPRSTAPFRLPLSTGADAVMEKAYAEVTAWLAANAEAIQGGTAGTGSLSGGVANMFAQVKRQFPQARLNSGYRPGDPGYHGRGRAIDLGQEGRAGGNGHPYLAAMNRWLHDSFGANLVELIYTGAGDDRPDLKNGRPLNYGAATNAAHRNHVHVAMEKGGILNPHVRDQGGPLLPGYTFNGTGMRETVLPNHVVDARGGAAAGMAIDYDRLAATIAQNARSLTVVTRDDPRSVVRAVRAEEQRTAALASAW